MTFAVDDIWILTVVICAIAAFVCLKCLNKKRVFLIIVGIILILIFTLRSSSVGVDTSRYQNLFNRTASASSFLQIFINTTDYGRYPAFGLLNLIISKLGLSFQWLLLVVGVFIFFLVLRNIYKYSKMPFLSLMIYFGIGILAFQFSGMKQAIAMSVIFLAFDAIRERNLRKFVILIIIAVLFHSSAIIFAVAYPVCVVHTRRLIYIIMGAVLVITYIFRMSIGRFLTILYDESYVEIYESSGGISGVFIALVFVVILYILFKWNDLKIGTIENDLLSLMLIAACIQIMSAYAYTFTRINYFYLQFVMLAIPNILDVERGQTGLVRFKGNQYESIVKPLAWGIVVVFFLVMYFSTFGNSQMQLTPYSFFWQ